MNESAVSYFQQGVEYQERGLFDQAIEAYRQALDGEPENLDVLVNLGAAYLQKGLAEKSAQVLQKALSIQPEHPLALFNLGKAYLYREDADKALDVFQRARQVLPEDPDVKKSIAQCFLLQNKRYEAVELLWELSRAWPGEGSILLLLGRGLIELERFEEALDVFRKAVTAVPDSSEALNGIIQAQLRLGHVDKAMTTLKRALMVDPRHAPYHLLMVDLLIESDRIEEAISHLKRALSAEPNQPQLRRKMEELTRRLPILKKKAAGQHIAVPVSQFETDVYDVLDKLYDGKISVDQAVEGLERLRDQDPKDTFILEQLAGVFFKARLYPKAMVAYEELCKAVPGHSTYVVQYARSVAVSGNYSRAVTILETAAKDYADEAEPALALVEMLLVGREHERAHKLLERVRRDHPQSVQAHFLSAYLYLQKLDLDASAEAFSQVLSMAPDDEEIALWYSRLMVLRGTPQEAVKVWDRFQDGMESLQEIISRIELCLAAGEASKVNALLRKIGDYQPRFVEDQLLFGKAFFYAGDFNGAQERFEQVLQIDGRQAEALTLLALTHLVRNKPAKFWMSWQKAIESDSLVPVIYGMILRGVLNFTQRERLKAETTRSLELIIRDDLDRARMTMLMKAL